MLASKPRCIGIMPHGVLRWLLFVPSFFSDARTGTLSSNSRNAVLVPLCIVARGARGCSQASLLLCHRFFWLHAAQREEEGRSRTKGLGLIAVS